MKQVFLSISLAATLLVALNFSIFASPPPASPLSSVDIQVNPPTDLINSTTPITFTSVTSIYLPIVARDYTPPSPTITDISYYLISRNEPDCDFGDLYEVSFKYTDPTGDGDLGSIRTTAVFFPSRDTFTNIGFSPILISPSDGYSGTAVFEPCIDFTGSDTRVEITAFLVDGAGFASNSLKVTIPKS